MTRRYSPEIDEGAALALLDEGYGYRELVEIVGIGGALGVQVRHVVRGYSESVFRSDLRPVTSLARKILATM